jgi:hypothetical protein
VPSFKNSARGIIKAFLGGDTLLGAHRHAKELDSAETSKQNSQKAKAHSEEEFRKSHKYIEGIFTGPIMALETLDKIKHIIVSSGVFVIMQNAHMIDTSALTQQQIEQLNAFVLELVDGQRNYAAEKSTHDHVERKSRELDEATRALGDRLGWNGKQR